MENYLNSDNKNKVMSYVNGITVDSDAWLNNKTGWNQSNLFLLPDYFVDGSNNDKGLRIEDLNLDGFPDLIQGWGGVRKAWLNNGGIWK